MTCYLLSYLPLQETGTVPLGCISNHSFSFIKNCSSMNIRCSGKAVPLSPEYESYSSPQLFLLWQKTQYTRQGTCACTRNQSRFTELLSKLLSGPSMRCSTSWKIKSGSFNGCSADPHTVSIVCASDRSRMSPSFGHRLKKCWCCI
jgi:hypothetical protein